MNTITTYLTEMAVSARGYIVGYDRAYSGYIGKLLSKGLAPGTRFILIRQACSEFPLQLEVEGNLVSLSKPEVDALCVEEVD
ncbi:FeoA family protein [Chroococcus sp. FPU101]|uniref:FeoA family protein n=1 Tax=Chroococcus sp. FPU101 TaxID=1974212 RepID=UPI001A8EFFF5|nr:FeoA family protein [Chroococcus sp. FPU101]GFE71385.1 FeoA family protein [Chroococcus sp. FPU101]